MRKSEKIKGLILLILVIIASVIWVKNLNIFEDKKTYFKTKKPLQEVIKTSDPGSKLEYVEPRLNPFVPPPAPKSRPPVSGVIRKNQPPVPKKISSRYKIDGIVAESDNPQVILTAEDGHNLIVSINDTVDGWQVKGIHHDFIIVSYENIRDTLRLINRLNEDQK